MEIIKFAADYSINDIVYHVLRDSPKGIVLDVMYNKLSDVVSYSISWGNDLISTCVESELSSDKVFNNE